MPKTYSIWTPFYQIDQTMIPVHLHGLCQHTQIYKRSQTFRTLHGIANQSSMHLTLRNWIVAAVMAPAELQAERYVILCAVDHSSLTYRKMDSGYQANLEAMQHFWTLIRSTDVMKDNPRKDIHVIYLLNQDRSTHLRFIDFKQELYNGLKPILSATGKACSRRWITY